MRAKQLKDVIQEYFKKFDTLDLLTSLSAINLVFDNQGKNILTTYATIIGLFNQNKDLPKPSKATLARLISDLDNSDLKVYLDPPESPFFEIVHYGKDFHVFSGINTQATFILNSIIKLVVFDKDLFPKEFKEKLLRLTKGVLEVSDNIFRKVKISLSQIEEHIYCGNTIIPANLFSLKNLIEIDKKFFLKFALKEEVERYFISNVSGRTLEKELISDVPFYYDSPFLDIGDSLVLLDPTCLCCFLTRLCLKIAREYKCFETFENELFNMMAFESIEYSKMLLGLTNRNADKINVLSNTTNDFVSECYVLNKNIPVLIICFNGDGVKSNKYVLNVDTDVKKLLKKIDDVGLDSSETLLILILNSIDIDHAGMTSNLKLKNHIVLLSSQDLYIIYSNERTNPFYLLSFIRFLNYYFNNKNNNLYLEPLNLVSLVKRNNYDFYFGDDINAKNAILDLGFDFIYPYRVMALKEKLETSSFYDSIDKPLFLIKYDNNIYIPNPFYCGFEEKSGLYLKINDYGFWITSDKQNSNAFLVSKTILYWLNEISETLNMKLTTNFYIDLIDGKEMGLMKCDDNHCIIKFSEEYIGSFGNNDNSGEIEIIVNILRAFNLFSVDIERSLLIVASKDYKKVIYSANESDEPYLAPLIYPAFPMLVSKIDSNIFEDEIGDFLARSNFNYGKQENPDDCCKNIVNFLFKKFECFISNFSFDQSIDLLYIYAENTLRELLLTNNNLKYQIATQPEEERKTINRYNDLHTSTMSVKFLAEYFGAKQPNGSKILSEADIQYAISIVASIIKWARIDDSLKYNIIDSVTFLKSGRVGYDNDPLDKFNMLVSESASFDAINDLDFDFHNNEAWPLKKDFDEALSKDRGFITDDLVKVMSLLFVIGESQNKDIKRINLEGIFKYIEDYKLPITKDTLNKVLDYLSIRKRKEFYDVGSKPRNFHPWKYNRPESLSRKPIIVIDNDYIWGNRTLYNSVLFIMRNIHSGKEPIKESDKFIQIVNGKILDEHGKEFNDYCFEYLKREMPDIIFEKNIVSFNNKKMALHKGETLGDIDILGIDKKKRRIYLIETKNFFYARDPSELDKEIKVMFIGSKSKKPCLDLELNRVSWVESHLDDVLKHFNLEGNNWKVKYTFLTNQPLLSKHFYKKDINSISLKQINKQYLRKL